MESTIVEGIVKVVLMIIAGYGGWLTAKSTFKKQLAEARSSQADAADKISAAWERLSKPQMERIAALERRVSEIDKDREALRKWAEALVKQVVSAGLTPVKFEDFQEGKVK